MRRTWCVTTVVLIAILLATSVGFGKTKLTHVQWVGGYNPAYMEALNSVALEFEKLHPEVEIEIVAVANNLPEVITVRNLGGVAWDTATLMPHQGLGLALQGAFLDLAPYVAKDNSLSEQDYLPGLLDSFRLDETLWGLPQSLLIQAFGYNQTLFDEAGQVSPARLSPNEWNWTNVQKIAKKLGRDTNGDGQIDIWGIDMNMGGAPALLIFTPYVDQAGGKLFDRRVYPTEANFLSPEVRQAAEHYLSYWTEGLAPFGQTPYLQGKAAMNPYDAPRVNVWEPLGMEGHLFTHPVGPVQSGTIITSHGVEISASTQHPELAWEWAKFLTTSETGLTAMFQSLGWLPPLRKAINLWAKYAKAPDYQKVQIVPVVNDTNRPRYVDSTADAISNLINKHFSAVIKGTMSLGNALETLQVEANALLADRKK
jgi:multiple sugar transport system substrate-binding protein